MRYEYPNFSKQPSKYVSYLVGFFTKVAIDFPTDTHEEYLKECKEDEWTTSNQYFDDINSILNEEIFTYDNHKKEPRFFEKLESKGYRDTEKVIELLYKHKEFMERIWEDTYETR